MKLAEALSIRSQLTNKVTQLRSRLNDCVRIQEGDEMTETPWDVVEELDSTLSELRRIIYAINMTNTHTVDEAGRNLTSLIAERDILKQRVAILGSAIDMLIRKESRYNRMEIRFVRTVDVNDFRKIYNDSASRLRTLDLHIQSLGFTTDLIEK
ncbi:MAG: DIP1984 family protein [Bacteroides sp.]|nr:DIP1984 family protein [Bacteroides sp.]MCM1414088.1 DIP1984 family protein [Bacteroides sp.]MCM1472352.1 DIP1984 family protein [Bacteroides sp.]